MRGPGRWNHDGIVDRLSDLTFCIQMGRSLDNTNDRVTQWKFTVDGESWKRYAFVLAFSSSSSPSTFSFSFWIFRLEFKRLWDVTDGTFSEYIDSRIYSITPVRVKCLWSEKWNIDLIKEKEYVF